MNEERYILKGELYNAADPSLTAKRRRAHHLCERFNRSDESDTATRLEILQELVTGGQGADVAGPIYFDFGEFTIMGNNVYVNFNFTVLDVCPVTIGDNVMFGPNVSLVTPIHPMRWQERNVRNAADGSSFDYEYGAPITIGRNCWIASGVTVTGGVTIGEGCVIGAGSVVTHDIPANSFAAGVPCKVIRAITDEDSMTLPNRVRQ